MKLQRLATACAILAAVAMLQGMVLVPAAGARIPSTGTVSFSVAKASVYEGAGTASIQLSRSSPEGPTTVTVSVLRGTATAGTDYSATNLNGSVAFGAGSTSVSIDVAILVDQVPGELNETVRLGLSEPTGGRRLGNPKAMTLTILEMPAPPAPVLATPAAANPVVLSWTEADFAYGAVTFSVCRSTEPPDALVRSVVCTDSPISATTYTDSGVTAGTTYYYTVVAENPDGAGAKSSEVSVTVPSGVIPAPPAPTITECVAYNETDLRWTMPAYGYPVTYAVWRTQVAPGAVDRLWVEKATGITDPVWRDSQVVIGGVYYYRVQAVNSNGVRSDFSNECMATVELS